MKIDTYRDVTCNICNKSWSTDYDMGMRQGSVPAFKKALKDSGWTTLKRKNACPECRKERK